MKRQLKINFENNETKLGKTGISYIKNYEPTYKSEVIPLGKEMIHRDYPEIIGNDYTSFGAAEIWNNNREKKENEQQTDGIVFDQEDFARIEENNLDNDRIIECQDMESVNQNKTSEMKADGLMCSTYAAIPLCADNDLKKNFEKEKRDLEENIKLVCIILDEVSVNLENRKKRVSYLSVQWEEHNKMIKRLQETEDIAGGYFLPEGLNSNKKEQAVFRSEMKEIESLLINVKEEEKLWEERKQKLKKLIRYLKAQKKEICVAEEKRKEYTQYSDGQNTKSGGVVQNIAIEQNTAHSQINLNGSMIKKFTTMLHKIQFVSQLIGVDGIRAMMELKELENILKEMMEEQKN